ncbi:MAG: hypothetical protein JOY71_20440 [Acetobacteraceae bacterium]|nr:hypothetical protein [Acetobacteraceae bacterium]MBV8524461.1 hypothetical protein [Acetobacteraceae bacterium]MBV8589832.1 hypothetical protein [Acetobacteraceae bacterium]
MSLAPPHPATSLSHRLGLTLAGLCEALAARMAKDRTNVPLLFLAWTRLRRLAVRFEALFADFRAGRLSPAPSVRGAAETLPQLPGLPGLAPPFRAPRDFGWLLRLAPESAAFAGQVEHLLGDPEMKALLAGSPQAGRMLGPLCRMLGIEAGLELLPRRRRVRASPADEVSLGDAAAAAPVAPDALDGGPGLGSRSWPAELGLLVGTSENAGADPPPAVSWRRAEPG